MQDVIKIEAKKREENKNPRQIRKEGNLPVTIYGKDVNINAQINAHEFKLAYQKNSDTKFEISYDSKKYLTTPKNVQTNFATCEVQSVEFTLV